MKFVTACSNSVLLAFWALLYSHALGADQSSSSLKIEHFDSDPGWEGHNNRIVPKKALIVKQDFGYSGTHYAGQAAGEMGGVIQRSTKPASYAASLVTAKSLDEKLTASGSFAFTASQPGAGVFFGFFNSQQPGGSGRPIGSLGLNLDFEKNGARLAVRLITAHNQGCGTFITRYEQYRKPELKAEMRPTPIITDLRYTWQLDYDPEGNKGDGRFQFSIKSNSDQPQDWEGQVFAVDLPPGYKKDGTSFDRFGVMNMMKAGGTATIFFDDLQYAGHTQEFANDPKWIGSGNRVSFEDREVVGAHDFGYNPTTNLAGGSTGEIGGGLWRSGEFGYYADRIGPLNLEQRLEARGTVKLVTAGPDSDMFIGWFNSDSKEKSPADNGHFIGIHVGGPTRVGHYFLPRFATAKGTKGKVEQGPVLTPGTLFEWSLIYDPVANNGNGEMRLMLGQQSVTLALKPGQKAQGAILNRFGLFTSQAGGQMVKIYLDDLKYSVGIQ
ncbi:MAG: hypothetical protein SGI77_05350 [Pirellulaceae bacterium]|nr:hypothetical protein [Pirellulaceae bacterium]